MKTNLTKILFIRASGFEAHSIPYGLLFIKTYLRTFGFDALVFDRESCSSTDSLADLLLEFSPDIIGISAMTAQFKDAKDVIKLIRELLGAKVKIVCGGVHFTALPQSGLEIGADYVIRGEGEISLLKCLTEGFPQNSVIAGEEISNLGKIPMPLMRELKDFVRSPERYYDKGFHIITARGCPYNCNFCLGREQRPKGLRYHPVDAVVNYISDITEYFQINSFNLVDDIFVLNKRRVLEFCEKISVRIPSSLRFHCFTHAGHGNVALYQRMKEIGFHRISMGVEHGNDRILELMGKRTTKTKIEQTCSQIYQAGIDINLTYILGNVHETDATVTETVDFAIYLHERYNTSSWFSFMQPLPGSPVFEVAQEFGKFLPKKHTYQNIDIAYIPSGVSVDHLIRERERGMQYANYNNTSNKHRKQKSFRNDIKKYCANLARLLGV